MIECMKYKIHSNYSVTGGPQSAHQVCRALVDIGKQAVMSYPPVGETSVVPLWSEIYGLTEWEPRNQMVDERASVVVLPAGWGPNWYPVHPDQFSCIGKLGPDTFRSVKVLWWLGLGTWQDWDIGGWDRAVNLAHPNVRRLYHACQSQEAYDFLASSCMVPLRQIFMLRDYTHEFFHVEENELESSSATRKNIVLHNAAKGGEFHARIKEACSGLDCDFVAISGLSREELKAVAMSAKVYIDFGHHPGRDRIPREMAACGLSVITGCEGTAGNEDDVPVGKRKFRKGPDGEYDYGAIRAQISRDLESHVDALCDEDMLAYREKVRLEKSVVYEDVRRMTEIIDLDIKTGTVPCWRDLPEDIKVP